MSLVVDPTFVLTRRGQVWLDRAARTGRGDVATSATLLTYGPAACRALLEPYRGFFGRWTPTLPPITARAVECRWAFDPVSADLLAADARVVADVWLAVQQRGMWLAVRRQVSLDAFVAAGVTLVTRRTTGLALDELGGEFGSDLAEALHRRTRYFARLAAGVDLDDPRMRSAVLDVYDDGRRPGR